MAIALARQVARGGSASDAPVAAAYVLAVLLPDACGLCGDAFALVRTPDGAVSAYNGSGAARRFLRGPIPADPRREAGATGA